jgi:hypothetical protein
VVATHVGGNSEAVNESFGALVDVFADKFEIARVIESIVYSQNYSQFRLNAYIFWFNNFQASHNYKKFCLTLIC